MTDETDRETWKALMEKIFADACALRPLHKNAWTSIEVCMEDLPVLLDSNLLPYLMRREDAQ